jgi:hypothetical protein
MRSAILARWISTAVVAIAASGGGCTMGGGNDPVFSSVEGENQTGEELAKRARSATVSPPTRGGPASSTTSTS